MGRPATTIPVTAAALAAAVAGYLPLTGGTLTGALIVGDGAGGYSSLAAGSATLNGDSSVVGLLTVGYAGAESGGNPFAIQNWLGANGTTVVATMNDRGQFTAGVWKATPVADAYIASAAAWNAKQAAITTGTTSQYIKGDLSLGNVGSANGLATLDGGGKLTSSQIPASLIGALNYQGTWNATTNTPTLVSSTGTKGFYYKVATAGTTSIDGIASWNVGDSIVFDGVTWDKIDGITNEVISVAGLYGAISAAGLKTALAIAYADVTGVQATITTGTTAQYLRGDLSLATLNATAVGLANVPNVNCQNASNLTSGTVATARLGSGSATSATYLRGDNTWATPAGGGGTPAGSSGQIQINQSGSFGVGAVPATIDPTTGNATFGGSVSSGRFTDPGGRLDTANGANVLDLYGSPGDYSSEGVFRLRTAAAGNKGIVIQRSSSQTADLLQFRKEDYSTVMTAVHADGGMSFGGNLTLNGHDLKLNDGSGAGGGIIYADQAAIQALGDVGMANGKNVTGGSGSVLSGFLSIGGNALVISGALADGVYACGTGSITITNGVITAIS